MAWIGVAPQPIKPAHLFPSNDLTALNDAISTISVAIKEATSTRMQACSANFALEIRNQVQMYFLLLYSSTFVISRKNGHHSSIFVISSRRRTNQWSAGLSGRNRSCRVRFEGDASHELRRLVLQLAIGYPELPMTWWATT